MVDIREEQDRLARDDPFTAVNAQFRDHAVEGRLQLQVGEGGLAGSQLGLRILHARFDEGESFGVGSVF